MDKGRDGDTRGMSPSEAPLGQIPGHLLPAVVFPSLMCFADKPIKETSDFLADQTNKGDQIRQRTPSGSQNHEN